VGQNCRTGPRQRPRQAKEDSLAQIGGPAGRLGDPLGDDPGHPQNGDQNAEPGAERQNLAHQDQGQQRAEGRPQHAQQQRPPGAHILERLKIGRVAQADADNATQQEQAQRQRLDAGQRIADQEERSPQGEQRQQALDQVQLQGGDLLAHAVIGDRRHRPQDSRHQGRDLPAKVCQPVSHRHVPGRSRLRPPFPPECAPDSTPADAVAETGGFYHIFGKGAKVHTLPLNTHVPGTLQRCRAH